MGNAEFYSIITDYADRLLQMCVKKVTEFCSNNCFGGLNALCSYTYVDDALVSEDYVYAAGDCFPVKKIWDACNFQVFGLDQSFLLLSIRENAIECLMILDNKGNQDGWVYEYMQFDFKRNILTLYAHNRSRHLYVRNCVRGLLQEFLWTVEKGLGLLADEYFDFRDILSNADFDDIESRWDLRFNMLNEF